MSINKTYNLNKYTVAEKGPVDKIHFYIEAAMLDKDVIKKNNSLHVTFELNKEKEDKLYDMHIYLINKNRETVYRSYSVYLKQIDEYNYAILNSKNDITHAEILPKSTIDFNTLDYKAFKKLLSTVEEFTNMIPDLTKSLKDYKEEMTDEKEAALTIDIPTPTNYYHNVVGNAIIAVEEIIANEKEQDITNKILNTAKKNFEVVMTNNYDRVLGLLNLQAYAIYKARSENLAPQNILKDADLKTDTNKTELSLDELLDTLNNFINEENPIDNIISERIHYILEDKPRLKEITNYIKIILADDKYINKKRRVRAMSEYDLKELIIKSFIDETYLPLPRNEVLIYHLEDEKINFLTIISLDLITKLFKTYKLNSGEGNESSVYLYNDVEKVINNQNISRESSFTVLFELIVIMYLYYLKNINSKSLLFNKGEHIVALDYYKGEYDIKIINKNNKKVFGKFIKLTPDKTKEIKESLDKGERYFVECINNIIYTNLHNAIINQNLTLEMKALTHNGIKFILRRPDKENIFECNFPIAVILTALISPNKARPGYQKEEKAAVDDNYKYNIPKSDYEYIVRKADTIAKIMENSPLNNKTYYQIARIYGIFKTVKEDKKKTELLLKLAELFKIEITDIKKEDNE